MPRWPGILLTASVLVLQLALHDLAAAGSPSCGREGRPNIVLVVWDDAELDHLGFLGNGGQSPNLDALVRSGTLFSSGTMAQARGRPTTAVLLTGQHPHRNGIYGHGSPKDLAPDGTLARRLHDSGYATLQVGQFREGQAGAFGFDRTVEKGPAQGQGELARFLDEFGGKQPLFLWWAPEARNVSVAVDLDVELGKLLGAMDERGLRANTLFCFVPNGEARKREFSARECSEEALRNPIALVLPDQIASATRIELVTTLDLFPTLLDYAGLPFATDFEGRSLRPLLTGETLAPRQVYGAFFEQLGSKLERDLRVLVARDERWKYSLFFTDMGVKVDARTELVEIERSAGDQTLFDLESDPHEEHDLFGNSEHVERLAEMRAAVLSWWRTSGGGDLDLPFLPPALGPVPPRGKHPNVVLIVADDQDYEHLGFMGNARVHTPTLDALASAGFVFPVAHVPMSRCRPSLAALLSGRWPLQTGIYDNESAHTLTRRDSLPNLLKAAGYATFLGGKFWEGSQLSMGFLEPKVSDTVFRNFVRESQDELFAFIDQYHEERPLFLWWAPMLPHGPFNPPERFQARFRATEVPVPAWVVGDAKEYQEAERTAYAMGAWLDEGLAALRNKLAATGELEDTLFVFLIDNGYVNGLPSKGSVFEKGLRTPVFFSWPRGIAPGRTSKELVSTLDIYRTILDYAGVPCPEAAAGIDLRPLLDGHEQPVRDVLYGAGYAYRDRPGREKAEDLAYAIYARTERWKFVLYLRNITPENVLFIHEFAPFPARTRGERDLFDLQQDPYEQVDLSDDPGHAALMDELLQGCLAWWRESGGRALDLGAGPGDTPGKKKGKKK